MLVLLHASIVLCCWIVNTIAIPTTRVYNFTIGWANRNPDGRHERRVIAINDLWPPPTIEATVGDRVIVHVYNDLRDRPTSLHFHGLFQNGTNHMDGATGVTQCSIPPGSSMTYNFTIDQPGTYWYHSHESAQYPDGLRAPLIVHDPDSPYGDLYDQELVLTLSDWYHTEMSELLNSFISVTNPTGAEPVPESALHNDTPSLQIHVSPGKTYLLRIINVGAFAGQYIWIEGHSFRIIELDGVYHEPKEVDMIYMSTAQRVSVLLTAKNENSRNYPIVTAMDMELFDTIPDALLPNVTSYLVYNSERELPSPAIVDTFEPFDDFNLTPSDREELLTDPDMTITLDVVMDNLGDGVNYAFFNNITYKAPVVPSLYTALSADGDHVANPAIYGSHTNTFILEHGRVIELVLNNQDDNKHPFHIHGHNFQLIYRSEDDAGKWDPESNPMLPRIPSKRDTVLVRPNGHLVVRFRSDNPGVWIFHCHIEWHMKQGLAMTLVEAPDAIRSTLTLPHDHLEVCRDAGIPTAGNAAGHTIDWLDLSGQPSPPAPLPEGFTLRGIVALVFSIITGILGTVVIVWYAYAEEEVYEEEPDIGGRHAHSGVGFGETEEEEGEPFANFGETDSLLQHRVTVPPLES